MKKIYKSVYICIIFFIVTASLKAQCTFTTAVPYFETFAGIANNNQLPTCWLASNPSVTCLTYTSAQSGNRSACTGNSFASFSNTLGAHYFYTNGIQLNAGVTYSTSIWFKTEYYGYTNWTDLSILYGTAQNSLALTSIVSTNSAAVSAACKSLSGTFSVSSSGIYYCAIRATSNGMAGASYLSWDDFLIEAPCQLNGNSFSITASSNSMCVGQSVTLTANGNPNTTYTWNTGATGSVIVVSPNSNINFSVLGVNPITSCYANSTINIQVNPISIASIFTNKSAVCVGESATLIAFAGSAAALNTFSWSNGATTNTAIVSPTLTTNYSVTVTNSYNCSGSAVQQIIVNPLPTIAYFVASTFVCVGDQVSISLNGAKSYFWYNNLSTASGSSSLITKQFASNELLIVTGTDNNGCSRTFTLNLNVNECTGFNENSLAKGLFLFPNPVTSHLEITGLNNLTIFELFDLSGNIVISSKVNEEHTKLDLSNLTKGIYFLKIKSGDEMLMKKILKE